jgi:hypothetical protein
MNLYNKLARNPKLFLSFTGMHLHTFQELLPLFEQAYSQLEKRRKETLVGTGRKRLRAAGAGKHFSNDLTNRLLMLLIYYRLYLTQDFMTVLFKASNKSIICRSIQHIRPVVESVVPTPERSLKRLLSLAKSEHERRKKRIGTIEEFREAYPELSFIIDGVEQPKRKPKNKEKRKSDYSGKKKRHTRKQLITSTPTGIIVDQSPSVGGRTHDFQLFKEDHAVRGVLDKLKPYRSSLYGDSGFQGMQGMGLPVEVRLVERGRRNHPLKREQKKLNSLRSSTRVKIEHTISRRKKYRIAGEEYRNRDEDYDQTMAIIAGLVNLRAYERIFQRTGICL